MRRKLKNLSLTFVKACDQRRLNWDQWAALSPKQARVTLIVFRNALSAWRCIFRQSSCKQVRHSVRCYRNRANAWGKTYNDILDDEVIVLLGLYRRRTPSVQAQSLKALQGPNYSPWSQTQRVQVYNQQVPMCCFGHLGNESPFDSYAAPMSLISMLC